MKFQESAGIHRKLFGFPVISEIEPLRRGSQRNRRRLDVKAARKLDDKIRELERVTKKIPVSVHVNEDGERVILWGLAAE